MIQLRRMIHVHRPEIELRSAIKTVLSRKNGSEIIVPGRSRDMTKLKLDSGRENSSLRIEPENALRLFGKAENELYSISK